MLHPEARLGVRAGAVKRNKGPSLYSLPGEQATPQTFPVVQGSPDVVASQLRTPDLQRRGGATSTPTRGPEARLTKVVECGVIQVMQSLGRAGAGAGGGCPPGRPLRACVDRRAVGTRVAVITIVSTIVSGTIVIWKNGYYTRDYRLLWLLKQARKNGSNGQNGC